MPSIRQASFLPDAMNLRNAAKLTRPVNPTGSDTPTRHGHLPLTHWRAACPPLIRRSNSSNPRRIAANGTHSPKIITPIAP